MVNLKLNGKSLMAVSGDDYLYAICCVPHTEKFKIDVYNPKDEYLRTIEHLYNNVPLDQDELLER